jgi:hypothetical protein
MKEANNEGLRPETDDDYIHAAHEMERMGGGFAGHIARAYYSADGPNRKRLQAAFPELFTKYFQYYTVRILTDD